MDERHAFDIIDLATFEDLLQQYPNVVPNTLADLEDQRLDVIPQALQERSPQFLTKDELTALMDWKLSHGKFRPTLKKLIAQNEGPTVKSITIEAFALPIQSVADVRKVMGMLTKLRGVGPATASLLLSTKNQERMPFFSDELYRWALWKEPQGWKQEIKYSEKAYLELYSRVEEFCKRVTRTAQPVSALEVEKVAYVLGKGAMSEGSDKKGRKRKAAEVEDEDAVDSNQRTTAKKAARGISRKAQGPKEGKKGKGAASSSSHTAQMQNVARRAEEHE